MERISAQDGEDGSIALRSGLPDRTSLPSRTAARASIRASIDSGSGFWLLTGDAGVGKTWTWRGLTENLGHSETWLVADITPGLTAEQLYDRLTHSLGLTQTRSARETLREWLDVRNLDGGRTVLVLEECHNADAALLEEVRVLANQMEFASGLTSIGLVGQTTLLRRVTSRSYWSLASRISARVHLRSLDADEVATYLEILAPERPCSVRQAEGLHVATAGNPRLLRQKLAKLPAERMKIVAPLVVEPVSAKVEPRASVVSAGPLLGPSRPPIRLEEGVIEVGWRPDESTESDEDVLQENGELAVNDHYAALQAWNEWSRAQAPPPPQAEPSRVAAMVTNPVNVTVNVDDDDEELDESEAAEPPWVRADEQHGFSPFSPMFSRLKRTTDAE